MLIQRLGPYEIRRTIGRGGMGTVFEGVDVESGHPAAVKLLSPEMAHHPGFRERFHVEIDTLRKLNHPNIVRLFGFGEQDGQLFYAMELVSGSSLEEQFNRGRLFPWQEVVQIGIETCQALRHAHDRGVIHRDIKPGNLLVDQAGHIKLSDFGIARLFGDARLVGQGRVIGTAEYMAPEQAEGRGVDPRTDLYSLGAVFYVLLTRRPLFHGRSFSDLLQKQRFEQPTPLRQYTPETPIALETIVHQLLDKNPERRIPNAMLLARRLEAVLQAGGGEAGEAEEEDVEAYVPADGQAAGLGGLDQFAPTRPATGPEAVKPPQAQPPSGDALPATTPTGAPAGPARAEPAATPGHFFPVTPGELDEPEGSWAATTWISPQTWVLAASLIVVGLVAWYLLQPPSADALYDRIASRAQSGTADVPAQLEEDIREFLIRFPGDVRGDELREHARRLALSRLERTLELRAKGLVAGGSLVPIEQAYIEALNYARLEPELGTTRFQAILDLYAGQERQGGPVGQCLELTRRRLTQLHQQLDLQAKEHLEMLHEQLDEADRIGDKAPARAKAIYAAIVEVYGHKPWADGAVRRAQSSLAALPVPSAESLRKD